MPAPSDSSLAGIVAALSLALQPQVTAMVHGAFDVDAMKEQLLTGAKAAIRSAVKEQAELLRVPLRLEIKNGESVKLIEGAHYQMPRLLWYIGRKKNVYLYGMPGSGKSTAAMKCADALDLTYGYISLNPQTPDSRLLGYMDAKGDYSGTPFYRSYTQGGVFCIDELDNASASLLTTLNGMIENGHGAFPNGVHPRHENFVLVATGNTAGNGGDVLFPERRVFDAAFKERFVYLKWEYDLNLEESLTLATNPDAKSWLAWTRKARTFCADNKLRVFFSPRCSMQGADLMHDPSHTFEEIADAVGFRGCSPDLRSKVLAACPLPARQAVAA